MKKRVTIMGLILLLSALSITNGSLWGDEICRVLDPISGNLKATLHTALGYAQPGYMLYMMLWAKLAGSTEFALRCSNLIFVVIAAVYAMKLVDAKGWPLWYTLAFFLHPMFVYYMDEATPYIVVYALALAFTYYTFCAEDFHSVKNIVCINAVYLLGVFMHFMFGFIILFYFTKCVLCCRKDGRTLRRHIVGMCCFSPAYLPLLYLYLTRLGKTQTGFGLKSILYIIYSFLGMQGAGLSRNDLRAGNFSRIQVWQAVFLFLFVAALLAIVCFAAKELKKFLICNRDMLLGAAVFFAVICLTAKMVDLGLWERHVMTAFPAYMVCACGLFDRVYKRSKGGRAAIILYFILLAASCLNIRLNYYYACDDHKGMTKKAAQWLEDGESLVITMQDENRYYPIGWAAADSGGEILNMKGKTDAQVIEKMEHAAQGKKVMLILFEKECSKELYTYFDEKEAYETDDSCNSFKLVTAANP